MEGTAIHAVLSPAATTSDASRNGTAFIVSMKGIDDRA